MKKPVLRRRGPARAITWATLLVCLLPAAGRSAETAEIIQVPEARDVTVEEIKPAQHRIDRYHDWLYVTVQEWAQALDQRFVKEGETPKPTPPTAFRIGADAEFVNHKDGGLEFNGKLDVDLLLQLPNLEKRLKIFITSDAVDESPEFDADDEKRRLRAGARFSLKDYVNFDVGVRLDLPPVLFTAVRWQRQYEAPGWNIEPFAKLYLETEEGFGLAGGVTFDHWYNRWLFRASSYANWRKDEEAAAWTQTFLVAHAREILRFGRYGNIVRGQDLVRAYGVQVLASAEGRQTATTTAAHASSADTYELSFFIKRPTGRNWMYWHVTPLVRWEREYGWHPDIGIRAGIDVLFWDLSNR